MSVIHFGLQEFTHLFHVVKKEYGDNNALAQDLELLSKANSACFNYRYDCHLKGNNAVLGHVAQDFLEAPYVDTSRGGVERLEASLFLVTMLPYNCAEDKDFLDVVEGAREAYTNVSRAFIRVQGKAIEMLREQVAGLERAEKETREKKAPFAPVAAPQVKVSIPAPKPSPATFARLPDGTWGVRSVGSVAGTDVQVIRRDGRKTTMRLEKEVTQGLFVAISTSAVSEAF